MWQGVSPGRLIAVLSLLLASGPAFAADCNQNGTEDWLEIKAGSVPDCDGNGIPDPCDILPVNYTLATRGALPVGFPMSGVASGDLDGDGDLDIAASHTGFLSTSVLWNLGEGLFGETTRSRGSSPTNAVAIGNIDEDPRVDIVFATDAGFSFLINRGPDRFTSRSLAIAGNSPVRSLELADLDGDGDLDIAATAQFRVLILLNPGNGSFDTLTSIPVGSNPVALTVSNLDGDADLDIVTANRLDSDPQAGNSSILLNDGSGTFSAPRNFGMASGPNDIAAGDLDGDGDADIAAACTTAGAICLLSGTGDGGFESGQSLQHVGFPISVAITDLDGDRDLDVASTLVGAFVPGTVAVHLNHGDATFAKGLELPSGFSPNPILTADLTGDGAPEIAAGLDVGTLLVLEHVAAAHDTDCDASGIPDGCELAGNDCNRNSFLDECDLATNASRDCNGNQEPDECELDCNGNGTPDECDLASLTSPDCNANGFPDECDVGPTSFRFDLHELKSAGNNIVFQIQSADLDRDGHVDVFGFRPGFSAVVLWNDGAGSLGPLVDHGTGIQVNAVGAADLDGDDELDLVVGDTSPQGRLAVLRAEDNRSFAPATTIANIPLPIVIVFGDIDQDGDVDIASSDGSTGSLHVLSNDGDGKSFQRLGAEVFSPVPHLLLLSDMDTDGKVDLLMIRQDTGLPAIFWNTGGQFTGSTSLGGRTTPVFAATPDLDGDGDRDFVGGVFDGFILSVREESRTFRTIEFVTPIQLPSGFQAEDFDLDGDADIAAPTFIPNLSPALAIFRNLDGTALGEVSVTPIEQFLGLPSSGDFDGDGKADLFAAAQPFCFDGGCAFEPLVVSFYNRTHPSTSLDLDRNKRPDECDAAGTFRRGDASGNGSVDVTDAIFTLRALFGGGQAPACAETADSDNDGTLTLADPVLLLDFLFRGGLSPASPGTASCGPDPDPPGSPGDLGCLSYDSC
jgi:hypothetical protein